jgi:hypothetical protein
MKLRDYNDLNTFIDARGRLHIYLGPMGLVITAEKENRSIFTEEVMDKCVLKAVKLLSEVSSHKDLLFRWVEEREPEELRRDVPDVVAMMFRAAQTVWRKSGEPITPMAAVAGSIAELMVKELEELGENGLDKIVVNNYGDIAFKASKLIVGLIDASGTHFGYLEIEPPISDEKVAGGICTSGFGGRSFTKGIADAVTCIENSASMADAFATVIGNSVSVDSPAIKKVKAGVLQPLTDIPREEIVVRVGKLTKEEQKEALKNGFERAKQMGVKACIIKVGNYVAMYPEDLKGITLKKEYEKIEFC